MTVTEKQRKLAMLPWQALYDLAIELSIDEEQIKGKDKSTIISLLILKDELKDCDIEDLVNDYIYGDRVTFTLWNFDNELSQNHYDILFKLEGKTEEYLDINGFRFLNILSLKKCEDRIELLYVYSKEYSFINEDGKNDSIWEQHRGCIWIGIENPYLACISKHDKMTDCIIKYISSKIAVKVFQIKPPKQAIERCINQIARSRVVLQGIGGEKTIVSRSEGITDAQKDEIQRLIEGRFDTSGSYIAQINEDTQATVKYNVGKGSIGILKHLSAPTLFEWSKSAIEIIFEEFEKLKGRPAKEIFKELGIEIKWQSIYGNEIAYAEWFLTKVIACMNVNEEAVYEIPKDVQTLLYNKSLFTMIPRIYCEQCGSYETPYCSECGAPLKSNEKGQLYCACGAPVKIQCAEGHRCFQGNNWFIPTPKMYSMLNTNLRNLFKRNPQNLTMCVMGDCLHIAYQNNFSNDGVEVNFEDVECFAGLPDPKVETRKFVVFMGEKCKGICSKTQVNKCVSDKSMSCLPKIFYSILPGFRPQPHKGSEYGDISAEIRVSNCSYEMIGIIKKNSLNTSRSKKTADALIDSHLLSTSSEGQEIIRQFVEQGLSRSGVNVVAVIAPQYFDNSLKGTLRFLAKLGNKKVLFIELDELSKLLEANTTIEKISD